MKALRVQAVSQLKLIPQMINKNDEIWQGLRDRAKKLSERVRVAETSYNREWKERRRLFNIVQEYRGNIRVMCRVRPKLEDETGEMICSVPMEGAITVRLYSDCSSLYPITLEKRTHTHNSNTGTKSTQETGEDVGV